METRGSPSSLSSSLSYVSCSRWRPLLSPIDVVVGLRVNSPTLFRCQPSRWGREDRGIRRPVTCLPARRVGRDNIPAQYHGRHLDQGPFVGGPVRTVTHLSFPPVRTRSYRTLHNSTRQRRPCTPVRLVHLSTRMSLSCAVAKRKHHRSTLEPRPSRLGWGWVLFDPVGDRQSRTCQYDRRHRQRRHSSTSLSRPAATSPSLAVSRHHRRQSRETRSTSTCLLVDLLHGSR